MIHQQRGETLIEVVVATFVFAVGILGNIGLQSASVQNNKNSLHQTKAFIAANDIADRIRANRNAALTGQYDGYNSSAPPSSPGCDENPCTENQLAQFHLFDWSQNFTNVYEDAPFLRLLPDGTSTIAFNPLTRQYSINISWTEQAYEDSEAGSAKADRTQTHQLVITI